MTSNSLDFYIFIFNTERKSILKENQPRRRWKFPCSWFCPSGGLESGITNADSIIHIGKKGLVLPVEYFDVWFRRRSRWLPPLRPLCGSLAVASVHCPFRYPSLTLVQFSGRMWMLNLDLCCGFAVNRGAWAGCVGSQFTSACVCAGERWGLLNV